MRQWPRPCAQAGGIDILVNNAGIFEMAPILEITEASWDKQFAVNTKGLLFMLQAAARRMVEQGRGGKIVNFASQAGRRGEDLVAVYCASKAAVISLTQSAGLDLIKHKINVNGIAPGVIDTPMWDQVDAQFAKYENLPLGEKKRQVGLGRALRPDGHARGHGGCRRVPGVRRRRLHRGPDAQRRRRQLDELTSAAAPPGRACNPGPPSGPLGLWPGIVGCPGHNGIEPWRPWSTSGRSTSGWRSWRRRATGARAWSRGWRR